MKRIFPLIFLALMAVRPPAAPAAVEQSGNGVTFKLDASTWTERPKSVSVAGDFNGWNTGATPLADAVGDNVWTATVKDVAEGKHQYKFVVDGDRWLTDPSGDRALETDDTYGGKNSGFVAGPDVRKAPPPKANDINGEYVRFEPATDVTAVDEGVVNIRCRTLAGDVEEVMLVLDDIGPQLRSTINAYIRLGKVRVEGGYDVWAVTLRLNNFKLPEAGQFSYRITFQDHNAFMKLPLVTADITKPHVEPRFTSSVPKFDVPDWSHHAVWYQIFVDRFRNGDTANDPGRFSAYERLVPWNGDWFATLPGEAAGEENFYDGAGNVWMRRYGGDLQGVREKLPYLRSLGVNAIYLNPIFEAESMHKYDTADYRHVDDNFGVDAGGRRGPRRLPVHRRRRDGRPGDVEVFRER